MRENLRNVNRSRAVRDRWEFALDGRQMAAVAVGALVIVGSAFVLGMNTGKGLGRKSAQPVAASSLDAFDAAHENLPAPPEPKNWEYEKLGGARPADAAHAVRVAPPAAPAAAAAQARVPPPARPLTRPEDEVAASARSAESSAAAAAPPPSPSAAPAATPPATAPATAPAAPSAIDRAIAAVGGGPAKAAASAYVIQIGASPSRAEADRIARRFASRGARVLPADVDGKRWYRVRLAAKPYDSRSDAERALSQLARETGVRGFVTAAQ